MIGFGSGPAGVICSRAGCQTDATWRIEWRNPRIHTDGRVKVWTACDEHVDYLTAFLEARSFPLERRALGSEVAS